MSRGTRSCDCCEYRPVCSTRRTCGDSAWCCSTYKQHIDRGALLALADEMYEVAQRRRSMGYEGFAIGDEDRAYRIRELCGEDAS